MSTFRRKTSAKPVDLLSGTRASSFSSHTVFTSSGIASLDDILGGGLPLSCSLLVIAPDTHSSYGELSSTKNQSNLFLNACWPSNGAPSTAIRTVEDNDDNEEPDHEPKTTVSTSKSRFCQAFDLTQRIPRPFLDRATKSSQLVLLNASHDSKGLIDVIAESLGASSQDAVPIRICIRCLDPQDVLYFAYSLRTLLRRYPHVCASVSLPPNMSGDNWGGRGWLNKLSWLFDASVTLAGFSVTGSSTLRGISSVSGWTGGGENNLAFKCTRKRFVIETHHLDVEGGVGERRTHPRGM
ncbi:hypothetical protein EDB86DRAFT_3210211 [Lactarius hatsudake]|nr:hypothetical protein EDB86DRAFT_3210211 [Lactarius hatsudake]